MSFVTVAIRELHIISNVDKMKKVQEKVRSSQITSRVDGSKGLVADSLNNVIDELNLMGQTLNSVLEKNTENVSNIASGFKSMDNMLSKRMESIGR